MKNLPSYSTAPATSISSTLFYELSNEDCRKFLRTKPDNLVDAVITDPPYGIGYKGSRWDRFVPTAPLWREVLRVMRPGAFIVAASAAKTQHMTALALDKAGFEIKDLLVWHYTQSFPGAVSIDGPWRSNLRTNHDPWIVARKPLEKGLTLKENWDKWGTGAVRTGATGTSWQTNVVSCPKPSRADRDLGLTGLVKKKKMNGSPDSGYFTSAVAANNHATVKPIALMRKLNQLFCADGGVILDPFMGSGTTGIAALADGYQFLGCEIDKKQFRNACLRIDHGHRHSNTVPQAA
ncbi:DNA-methyltransferase [Phaeobacter inhibens]|uniref:DNA-methyltransferase n=1 Tax=Phaeobacter inhibens TaxID=221822 RepID=UPI000C9A6E03|nr:site-specific DNA-methyltransferase [Phaeobacter inhibens]AUQ81148.1 DNA modification methylase [Phaeobacter inhibens]